MAKSGLTHIDVGPELTRTEWESEESHAIINGTAFPGSPAERQLFYRNDLHEWYIYNGSAWVSLQGAGAMVDHGNDYHTPDFASEAALATHEAAATAIHGVGASTVESASGSQAKVDTHAALTTGVHGVGGNTLWHGGLTNIVDKTHLSQDFGASAGRLRNLIVTPIAGEIVRMISCGESPFDGVINGAPTATSVVYDGETKETMFTGLASGADKWGRIILHNTTRGNSRKVVSVNLATNTITTESSTDDWADDDVITCQSQTNTYAGYIDIDVSAEVAATSEAIFMFAVIDDTEGNQDNSRYIMFHPYEDIDNGKRQWINANLANIKTQGVYPIKIISQKLTMWIASGCVTVNIILSVKAEVEYADT